MLEPFKGFGRKYPTRFGRVKTPSFVNFNFTFSIFHPGLPRWPRPSMIENGIVIFCILI